MPRNDQVTRQLILLRKLEGSRGATLQELSVALPPDLVRHTRTIRRDLEALESTFPLITERKNGQTCWRLMDGYTNILPLALSTTELMALVFSKDLLNPWRERRSRFRLTLRLIKPLPLSQLAEPRMSSRCTAIFLLAWAPTRSTASTGKPYHG